jgi:hypothetical protein
MSQELILALLLAAEIVVFCFLSTNFLSRANAFEIVRLSVELGLLALALTPVIVAGGIDLSVGSLMGLSRRPRRRSFSPPTKTSKSSAWACPMTTKSTSTRASPIA